MIVKKKCIIFMLISFVVIFSCSSSSDSNRSLKSAVTNEDTTGAGDTSENITVSAKGRVAPGEYLSLKHNLNRDDLNFDASFVYNNYIYDYMDYYYLSTDEKKQVFLGNNPKYISTKTLANGNFIIAYQDFTTKRANFAIYDQFGKEIKAPTVVEDVPAHYIRTAVLDNGNFVISYLLNDISYYGYFVVYSPDGTKLQAATAFNSAFTWISYNIKALSGGNFVIAFINAASTKYGAFAIFNSNGAVVKSAHVFAASDIDYISVAVLTNNNFVICYKDNDNSEYGYFTIYDSEGKMVILPKIFNSATTRSINAHALVEGKFGIIYTNTDPYESDILYLDTYNSDGTLSLGNRTLSDDRVLAVTSESLANGHIVIVYQDVANNYSFSYRVYNPYGSTITGPEVFAPSSIDSVISITSLQNGSFVIAYRNANANGILWYSRDMSEKVPSLDLITIDSNEARLLNNTKQTLDVILTVD